VKIEAASADHGQEKSPVAAAIDRQARDGLGDRPEPGEPHTAVFELERPLSSAAANARRDARLPVGAPSAHAGGSGSRSRAADDPRGTSSPPQSW